MSEAGLVRESSSTWMSLFTYVAALLILWVVVSVNYLMLSFLFLYYD